MTSLIKETHRLAGQMKCFRRRVAYQLAETLERRQRLVSPARLEAATGAPTPGRAAGASTPGAGQERALQPQ
jgi:hypothetical protein